MTNLIYNLSRADWISSIWGKNSNHKYLRNEGIKQMIDDYRVTGKLVDFAYLPYFPTKLGELASIAGEECWKPENMTFAPEGEEENRYYKLYPDFPILAYYLFSTFRKVLSEGEIKITEDSEFACFHTGLYTHSKEDIYAYFTKNSKPDSQPFLLAGFYPKNNRFLRPLRPLPERFDYSRSLASSITFYPDKEIVPNIEHILYDHLWRFPLEFQYLSNLGKRNVLAGAILYAKIMVRETPTLVIPQNYKGDIQLLMPLQLLSEEPEIALVLEIQDDIYRANTVLPLDWAYMNARAITKLQVNWLKT